MHSRDWSADGSRVDACELEGPWVCTVGGSLARSDCSQCRVHVSASGKASHSSRHMLRPARLQAALTHVSGLRSPIHRAISRPPVTIRPPSGPKSTGYERRCSAPRFVPPGLGRSECRRRRIRNREWFSLKSVQPRKRAGLSLCSKPGVLLTR